MQNGRIGSGQSGRMSKRVTGQNMSFLNGSIELRVKRVWPILPCLTIGMAKTTQSQSCMTCPCPKEVKGWGQVLFAPTWIYIYIYIKHIYIYHVYNFFFNIFYYYLKTFVSTFLLIYFPLYFIFILLMSELYY